MGRANEIRRLIELAQQFQGPMVDRAKLVQDALAKRADPTVQLERKRRRLARKRAWASRWATVWAVVTAICMVVIVGSFTGVIDDGDKSVAVVGIVIGLF